MAILLTNIEIGKALPDHTLSMDFFAQKRLKDLDADYSMTSFLKMQATALSKLHHYRHTHDT